MHTALTEDHSDSVELRISDVGAVVTGVLGAVAPDRAPPASDVSVTLATIGAGRDRLDDRAPHPPRRRAVVAAARCSRWCASPGPSLASRDRLRAAVTAGWALLWAAVGLGVVLAVVAVIVRQLDTDTLGGAVGVAAWRQFVQPIRGPVVVLGAHRCRRRR